MTSYTSASAGLDGDLGGEVFGLLAIGLLPAFTPTEMEIGFLGICHQLPQRVCSGFSPDSIHLCINVAFGLRERPEARKREYHHIHEDGALSQILSNL